MTLHLARHLNPARLFARPDPTPESGRWRHAALALITPALLIVGAWKGEPSSARRPPRVASPVDSAMLGSWCGSARINVNWTVRRTLEVEVAIAADGRVQGTVGDASLVDAAFRSNRNAAERAIRVKTDWIIEGKLVGDIVAAEHVRRTDVSIPLNWAPADSGGELRGGVNTSGTPFGGAGSMVLAASRLVLTRCSRPSRPAP
jgi:hypothetical protein